MFGNKQKKLIEELTEMLGVGHGEIGVLIKSLEDVVICLENGHVYTPEEIKKMRASVNFAQENHNKTINSMLERCDF